MGIFENRMTGREWGIYEDLKTNHTGLARAVSYDELCEKHFMSDREMREAIEHIKRFKPGYTVIGSTDDGIFIPLRHERALATAKYKATAMSFVENQVANDPETLSDFYVLLNELAKKYPAPSQGQMQATFNGKREDVNYVGDKYAEDRKLGGIFAVDVK